MDQAAARPTRDYCLTALASSRTARGITDSSTIPYPSSSAGGKGAATAQSWWRVRIDTRKWLMSKLNAAKYGDKVTLAGDAKNPLQHVVRALDLTKLSGPELDALERFVNARAAAVEVAADRKDSDEQN